MCDTLFHKSTNKKSTPRWQGPAEILDNDVTGAPAKFQSQTFKVARYCARKKVAAKDAEDAKLDPMHAWVWTAASAPRENNPQRDMGDVMDVDEEKGE